MKNKKIMVAVIIVCIMGIVGGTFAYFSTTELFKNTFGASTYEVNAYEVFESPDDWAPGDTTEKKVYVKNEGDIDVAVRVSFTEEWKDKNGSNLSLFDGDGNKASIINFSENYLDDWFRYETYYDYTNHVYHGYYYYKHPLKAGETTSSLIDSVTFNPQIDSSTQTTRNCSNNIVDHTTTCKDVTSGYVGGTYTLTIKTETAQLSSYIDAWTTDATIADYNTLGLLNIYGDNLDTVGTELCIKNECFYVIGKEDDTHVKLLAKYDLKVGANTYCPWGCGIQYMWSESDDYYNLQSSMAGYGNFMGGTLTWKFSETSYWVDNDAYGTGTYKWIYDDNCLLKQYVDNYVQVLNDYGLNVSGRLINKEEVEELFNGGRPLSPFVQNSMTNGMNTSISSDDIPEWVRNKGFWFGFSVDDNVAMNSNMFNAGYSIISSSPTSMHMAGVRPVIILEIPQE